MSLRSRLPSRRELRDALHARDRAAKAAARGNRTMSVHGCRSVRMKAHCLHCSCRIDRRRDARCRCIIAGYSSLSPPPVRNGAPCERQSSFAATINDDWTHVARRYWSESGLFDTVELASRPLADTWQGFAAGNQGTAFRLRIRRRRQGSYDGYYEGGLRLVRHRRSDGFRQHIVVGTRGR